MKAFLTGSIDFKGSFLAKGIGFGFSRDCSFIIEIDFYGLINLIQKSVTNCSPMFPDKLFR